MRFLIAYKKDNKTLVKIDFGGEVGEKWADTSEAVYNFAKKALKGNDRNSKFPGDEVNVDYTEKDGKYTVSRITKLGQASETSAKSETKSDGYVCEDCGASLKDGKYKKCYTCNKKNPVKKYEKKSEASYGANNSQDFINRQNANHATSRALIALQGHVDPNNILELIDILHKKFLEKIIS